MAADSRQPYPNHNYVPEYQVSGIPYVTSSHTLSPNDKVSIEFPYVTRWVVVHNTDNANSPLRFGFTENGVGANPDKNYFLLHGGEISPRLEVKTKDLWIHAEGGLEFSVIAGLTGIQRQYFPTLTGSLEDSNGNKLLPGVG